MPRGCPKGISKTYMRFQKVLQAYVSTTKQSHCNMSLEKMKILAGTESDIYVIRRVQLFVFTFSGLQLFSIALTWLQLFSTGFNCFQLLIVFFVAVCTLRNK